MGRKYVDISVYQSRNAVTDGNIDYKFWHNKTNNEKLRAAGVMISAAFGEPDFFKKSLDKTIFSARKHKL
jgi:hypothetical protein